MIGDHVALLFITCMLGRYKDQSIFIVRHHKTYCTGLTIQLVSILNCVNSRDNYWNMSRPQVLNLAKNYFNHASGMPLGMGMLVAKSDNHLVQTETSLQLLDGLRHSWSPEGEPYIPWWSPNFCSCAMRLSCGFEWKVSTIIRWTAMKFGIEIYVPHGMTCNNSWLVIFCNHHIKIWIYQILLFPITFKTNDILIYLICSLCQFYIANVSI